MRRSLPRNPNATIIPTTIDTDRVVRPAPPDGAERVPVVGWTGSFSTIQRLETLGEPLNRLARVRPFRLRLVGRRKAGFGLPIDDWFRGRSGGRAREILAWGDSGFGGIRQEEVGRIFDEHLERRADRRDRLWALLVLELWYDEMKDLRIGRGA